MSDRDAPSNDTLESAFIGAAGTENKIVADLASIAAGPKVLELDKTKIYATRKGDDVNVLDLQEYADGPARIKGSFAFHRAESFGAYVKKQKDDATLLFGDEEKLSVVAVINESFGDMIGWGDHRAVLRFRTTPEWHRWIELDGKMGSQTTLAELIEISASNIVSPDAADMLEIAQSLHATKNAEFESDQRLSTGQTRVRYTEEIKASAGAKKDLDIPNTFTLSLRPFEGAKPVEVIARFRFRVNAGDLLVGYVLERPKDVLRDAFNASVAEIEAATELPVLHGAPADERDRY